MAKIKHVADASERITAAFERMPVHIQPIVKQLRKLIHEAEPAIVEDWKWGPNFYYNGMVCNVWGFKNHASITFFNGSSMSDKHKLFNYGEMNANSRTIKFTHLNELNDKKLVAYIRESVKLNKQGLAKPKDELEIPPVLKKALSKHKLLATFNQKPYTFRKEIIVGITSAKRPETVERRVEQALNLLLSKS